MWYCQQLQLFGYLIQLYPPLCSLIQHSVNQIYETL